ncbi:MAG TPA: hypothetical protein VLG11_01500 [Candidatus Saccharimonadales bacterium]|nr:hypothetical protein [Candidatus Saccharimonadales bacterium]
MNRYTLGSEAFNNDGKPVDPFAPVVHGLEFIADHQRPLLDDEVATPDALATLRRLADRVIILDGLPEHAEVDPDLRASVHPYPPIRSELSSPSLDDGTNPFNG